MDAPFRVTNVARSFTTRMKRTGMHQSRRVILIGTKRLLPSSRPDRGTVQLSEEEMLTHKKRLANHIDRNEVRVWDASGREIPSKELLTFGDPIHCADPSALPEVVDSRPAGPEGTTPDVSAGLYAEAVELLDGTVGDVKDVLGESEDIDFLNACRYAEEAGKKRKSVLSFINERMETLG